MTKAYKRRNMFTHAVIVFYTEEINGINCFSEWLEKKPFSRVILLVECKRE